MYCTYLARVWFVQEKRAGCVLRDAVEIEDGVPLKLLPPETGQAGEGDPCGLRTGAKALFCLAEEGKEEKGRREEEELEPGIVGLEGMTVREGEKHRVSSVTGRRQNNTQM